MSDRIVITGATGFVGRHVFDALDTETREIVCTSRDPARARKNLPGAAWRKLDVDEPKTIRALLEEGDRVFYLIHGMGSNSGSGEDYADREAEEARAFADIAHEVGVARIIYLGGPKPPGKPSKHLASRLKTGEILRNSGVSTIELRAGMIMGAGSESWRITRDLSARLPVMLIPRWLRNECEPIAIDDVVAALVFALDADDQLDGAWDLPGPDRLTYEEVLYRVAELRGTRPFGIRVPFLTPRLSSHWLRLVTRADMDVARELVAGLEYDLVTDGDGFFEHMPGYERLGFDVAAATALAAEEKSLPRTTTALEKLLRRVSRSSAT